jgi:hypothetical protein
VYLVGAAVNSAGARWQAVAEPAWHPAGPASLKIFHFFSNDFSCSNFKNIKYDLPDVQNLPNFSGR